MKKTVLSIVGIILAVNNADAQKTAYGIQGGAVLSNISCKTGTGSNNTGFLPGFSAGVFTDFPLSSHLSFQPGINYTTKGGRENINTINIIARVSTRMNYIEFPFSLVYHFRKNQSGFFAGAGISMAFALTGKIKYDYSTNDSAYHDKTEMLKYGLSETDHFKSLDLGINLMAGYRFRSGVIISITCYRGLADISTVEGIKKTNNYFALKAGFLLKKKQ